jgi:hypothetical protein
MPVSSPQPSPGFLVMSVSHLQVMMAAAAPGWLLDALRWDAGIMRLDEGVNVYFSVKWSLV